MELNSFIREVVVKRFKRSKYWPKVRKAHLKKKPYCEACGRITGLEVHHIQDFSEHPELELDPNNLITLCGKTCHLLIGHLRHWKSINPAVRQMADSLLYRIHHRR